MPWLAAAIPIAMAMHSARTQMEQNAKNDKQRKINAEVDRWSPWTNVKSTPVGEDRDVLGAAGAGYTQGAAFGQQLQENKTADTSVAPPVAPLPENVKNNPNYFENDAYLQSPGYFKADRNQFGSVDKVASKYMVDPRRQPNGTPWDYDPRKGY